MSGVDVPPSDAFRSCCANRKVKRPNKVLLKKLSSYKTLAEMTTLNLSGNYLGTKQLMAVIDLIERCTNMVSIIATGLCCYQADLGGMWHGTKEGEVPTGNEVWSHFLETLRKHPSITSIDISDNDCGPLVGRILESTVKDNENIVVVKHRNVLIDPETLNLINQQVQKNSQANKEAAKANHVPPAQQAPAQEAANPSGDAANGAEEEEGGFGAFGGGDGEEGEGSGFGAFGGDGAEGEGEDASASKRGVAFAPTTNLGASRTDDGCKKTMMRRASKSCAPFNPEEIEQFVPKKFDKPAEVEGMLRVLLKQNLLFTHLQAHELDVVVGALFQRDYKKGEVVMTQGEEGDNMYTISKGTVDIIVDEKKIAQRGVGVSFGELALMYNTPRSATVIAATNVTTWGIDQDTYRNIVMSVSIKKRLEYQDVLGRIPFLANLKPYEKLQLADALETQEWDEHDVILEFDQPGEHMYIMLAGVVDVIGRDNSGNKVHVCEFENGKHFGELEFLNNHRTVADVVAKTKVRTARLKRDHFELCLGPIKDVLVRNVDSVEYSYYRQKSFKAP